MRVYARMWEETMSVRKRVWRTPKSNQIREAWIADYADQSGKQRIKTFALKRDAEAFEATVRVNVAKGVHSHSRMTVAVAGQLWLKDAGERGSERATLESYRQHLDYHIVPFLGGVRLADLTVPLVRAFEDRLRTEGRSPAMIRRVLVDLGGILGDAMERGLVAQNVVHARGKRQQKGNGRHKSALKVGVDIPSPDEIRAILSALSGRYRPLLLTAIFTGLRASELRGLRWPDIDLTNAMLQVRQRADRFAEIGPPKSKGSRRSIPLPPIVVNTLREHRLACPKGALDLVFPNRDGGIESRTNVMDYGLHPVQVAAGVVDANGKPKYALHALRHFYASWCINRKVDGGLELPLKMVQARLGHASIQITADTYGHLFPSTDTGAELAAAEKAFLR
jgi:integrase